MFRSGLYSRTTSPERAEATRVRPRESGFSFIPRADLRRSPDKRAASRGTAQMAGVCVLAFSLPRIVFLAWRARAHTSRNLVI